MAKVLRAPVDWTGTITTSEGDVKLVDGIAAKYHNKVAEHLTENVPGWRYAILEDGAIPKAAPAEEATDTGAEEPEGESSAEVIDLPVMQNTVREIRKFAKDHGITIPKSVRSKKAMLSPIYAHFDQS